jgi:NAD(P)-dependent dehydrogenase (short-subunit alcohol dehydrogenase family)
VIFRGKVAIVTGAAAGIGRATTLAFANAGVDVVAIDIDAGGLKLLERARGGARGEILTMCSDVRAIDTPDEAVEAASTNFGGVDYLFNNAGIEHVATLTETDTSVWDNVVGINLSAAARMAKACLQEMRPKCFGVIVNNSSDAGVRGMRKSAAYGASKAGLVQLTRSISLDYARDGIRCNCVCPGCIETELCKAFNDAVGARVGKSGAQILEEFVMRSVPMQRSGTPEEVASVVLFLCSADAEYINGAIIPIDGGLTAGV